MRRTNAEAFLAKPPVRLSELAAGQDVLVDADFTCIKPWSRLTVSADETGALFIRCREGRHYLDGQIGDDGDTLVGLARPDAKVEAA